MLAENRVPLTTNDNVTHIPEFQFVRKRLIDKVSAQNFVSSQKRQISVHSFY